eukprot:TRINITY_DN8314_c1_g1_i1.p1 TRINITY_DN8314_c1_g1~~TRINITY_DN8314_c1_g1_i1.p1  ORF type:complete len:587 (+),score=178.19 TRINITY_DN8314_c1_g1_i1:87-1763(+)
MYDALLAGLDAHAGLLRGAVLLCDAGSSAALRAAPRLTEHLICDVGAAAVTDVATLRDRQAAGGWGAEWLWAAGGAARCALLCAQPSPELEEAARGLVGDGGQLLRFRTDALARPHMPPGGAGGWRGLPLPCVALSARAFHLAVPARGGDEATQRDAAARLACCLLLEGLSCADVWCLGSESRVLGHLLAAELARQRSTDGGGRRRRCALVLLDRGLDLFTPLRRTLHSEAVLGGAGTEAAEEVLAPPGSAPGEAPQRLRQRCIALASLGLKGDPKAGVTLARAAASLPRLVALAAATASPCSVAAAFAARGEAATQPDRALEIVASAEADPAGAEALVSALRALKQGAPSAAALAEGLRCLLLCSSVSEDWAAAGDTAAAAALLREAEQLVATHAAAALRDRSPTACIAPVLRAAEAEGAPEAARRALAAVRSANGARRRAGLRRQHFDGLVAAVAEAAADDVASLEASAHRIAVDPPAPPGAGGGWLRGGLGSVLRAVADTRAPEAVAVFVVGCAAPHELRDAAAAGSASCDVYAGALRVGGPPDVLGEHLAQGMP